MFTLAKETFSAILKKKFSSLVGMSCKRIEVIRDNKDIPETVKLNLVRDLIKELDYEAMREITDQVEAFSNGINYKIVNPTTLQK
jgi:hypothetical protein